MAKTKTLDLTPLDGWHQLQAKILQLTESECEQLIEHELKTKKRRNIAMRLHMRWNKLRNVRERAVINQQTVLVRPGRPAR